MGYATNKLAFVFCVLAGSAVAQDKPETVVRFTGFLGNLQFTVADVRADLAIGEDDTARINIAMNETATAAFALFTKTHVNQSVAFFVCGQQMESVVVQAPIDSGYAVTGPLPVDVATEMVTALNDQGPCPD